MNLMQSLAYETLLVAMTEDEDMHCRVRGVEAREVGKIEDL